MKRKRLKAEIKEVIGFASFTDGKRYMYLSPIDGGTGDVEAVEVED